MSGEEILFNVEERMEKTMTGLKNALGGIRTGRANPGLVDSVRVDVYGQPTPIKQLASVGAPEPTQLVIRPFDPSIIKEIEKAITAGGLGFNPQNDGRLIRINVPPLSSEVRRKLVSRVKDLAEDAKVSIRNIRRDGNKAADQAEKDKEISEDQRDDLKDQIQKLTKTHEDLARDAAKAREVEVMEDT